MSNFTHFCEFCTYKTTRKYNLIRHHNNKHSNKDQILINKENVTVFEENVMNEQEKNNNNIDENDNNFYCLKCGKKYKTEKYLNNHLIKCNGLSVLQCPRCMKLFSHRSNKSNHIKNINCSANSIFNNKEQTININNITNNITNIYINNFGSERKDYIKFDDIIKIMKISKLFIIPEYIRIKHFNKDFPENHNIKFNNNNNCLIKQNNDWVYSNLNNLSVELLQENSKELNNYYTNKKEKINTALKSKILIEGTLNNINHSYLASKSKLYEPIKNEIKSIIRTSKLNN